MAFCPLAVCPLTPVSNYRQNVVFHQYGIFSICPYALSRSEDSSFGIPSCLSSSAFAISLASSVLDGAADICSYALFQADSNITISFNN